MPEINSLTSKTTFTDTDSIPVQEAGGTLKRYLVSVFRNIIGSFSVRGSVSDSAIFSAADAGGNAQINFNTTFSSIKPVYAFFFNGATGIGNPASNVLSFITAGVETGRISTAGFWGIGRAPTVKFDVRGATTDSAVFSAADAGGNAQIKMHSTYSATDPVYAFFFNGTTGLGNPAIHEVSIINNSAESLRATAAGAIKFPLISTTASAANAFLDSANGNNILRSTSQRKWKTDIENITDEYSEKIYDLQGIFYRSLCDNDNPDFGWYGFIAEDAASIDPRFAQWGYDADDFDETETQNEKGEKCVERKLKEGAELKPVGVAYDRLVVHLQNELKKQKARIDALEARLSKAGI